MTKYIERDKAVKLIFLAADTGRAAKALSLLGKESVADVAPVIYAHWKFVAGPDEDNNVQVMCDNCGAGDVQALAVTVPYCWKCGARMDGGENK